MIDIAPTTEQTPSPKSFIPKRVSRFVETIAKLEPGELAILKRNAGNTIAESRKAMWIFRYLDGLELYKQEIYFLAATLMPLNPPGKYFPQKDFGSTMRRIGVKRNDSEAVERRFRILLDSTEEYPHSGGSLAFHLRQAVKLAASHEVGVNWAQLLADLLHWRNSRKWVQKRWAASFYAPEFTKKEESETKNQEDTENVD